MKKRLAGLIGIICFCLFLCACDFSKKNKEKEPESESVIRELSENISEAESESEEPSETESEAAETAIKVEECSETRYVSKETEARSGNDESAEVVVTLKDRTKITVTGKCENGWYRIDADGTEAYIPGDNTISEKEYNALIEEEKKKAEEKAQKEAEEKAKKEAEEKARQEEEERARQEAEEKARKEAEEKAKQEAEQNAGSTDAISEVFAIVNQERANAGLGPLTLDPTLCSLAGIRASEITQSFSHTRPDGRPCQSIMDDYGVSYFSWGENIAAGQTTAQKVMEAWMGSPGHKQNILNPGYNKIGLGLVVVDSGYRYYWAQIFTD